MKEKLMNLPFYNKLVLPYHFLQALGAGIISGFPTRGLRVIGVTGTNGKTTTSFFIWKMLNEAGIKTGLLTTVAWGVDDLEPELNHMTTVDSRTLNRRLKSIREKGAKVIVLEITSHALAQFRTLGIPVEIAVFTNLTHEHLDYHGTFENYRDAKRKLFKKAKYSIINSDDESAKYFIESAKENNGKYITYGIKSGEKRAKSPKSDEFGVKYSFDDIKISANIPGEFNIYNSLAAALVGEYMGLSKEKIEKGISSLKFVEGRMNRIDEGQNFSVIVDYAHTPDALEKVFSAIGSPKGRIISVHGGAGRRDETTRFPRGEILGKNSDIVIITEDDSRDESPEKISAMFADGAKSAGKILGKDLFVELDRKEAIKKSLSLAKAGDIVLILGKGHEKTILRKSGPVEFEDGKVVRELLKSLR